MKRRFEFFRNRQDITGIIFVSLPILFYWVYWTVHSSYWFNADPAAFYFIDSLSVFMGKSYVYVDHPGTPMQLIGSFMLALAYPFFDNQDTFIQFFIARPGAFFLMANVFLLVANLFCAIVFYKTVSSSLTQNHVLGGIATSLFFFALHPHGYPSLTFWSHNSINYPIGTLLLIWLYRELKNSREIKPSKLILLGIASGILAIAQMYFFAWVASGIFTVFIFSIRLNNNLKQAIISSSYVAIGGIIGIISMLIPIYRELPRFAKWLAGIVTHLGLYGSGESGVYSTSLISVSVSFWWANIRLMMVILLLSLVMLALFAFWLKTTRIKLPAGEYAVVIGLLFHVGLVMLLMTKAALKLRYSLSLAAVLPVLIFMVLKLLEITPWRTKGILAATYILMIIATITTLIGQLSIVNNRAYVEQNAQSAKSQAVSTLANRTSTSEKDIVVVYSIGVPLKCAGLLHASNWTGYFKDEIWNICPNQFAVWDSSEFDINFNPAVPAKSLKDIDWDIVIWPGNGTNLPDYLYSVGGTTIPKSWHVPLAKWFFIHSEIIKE